MMTERRGTQGGRKQKFEEEKLDRILMPSGSTYTKSSSRPSILLLLVEEQSPEIFLEWRNYNWRGHIDQAPSNHSSDLSAIAIGFPIFVVGHTTPTSQSPPSVATPHHGPYTP